nr:glycogen debranching N-terminal domain-containing protein [Deinobacterium chartae]
MYWVGDADFGVYPGFEESGFYRRDTRYLSHYRWLLDGKPLRPLMQHLIRPYHLRQSCSNDDLGYLMKTGVRRDLMLGGLEATDTLHLSPYSAGARQLRLEVAADFSDMFQVRGAPKWERRFETAPVEGGVEFRYAGQDGVLRRAVITAEPAAEWDGQALSWTLEGAARVQVTARLLENDELPVPGDWTALEASYAQWMAAAPRLSDARDQEVLDRATADLRSLLFDTEHGPFPAAGIPWFVAPFGRDSLIIAHMLLPHHQDVVRGTLRLLAAKQGVRYDAVTLEQPGKILHEERVGEYTRTGHTPHRPYYGSVDATPLFVWLVGEYYRQSADLELVRELRPHWEAALGWMLSDADPDGDGFLEYTPHPGGITNQVWKDSSDSVFFEDGRDPDPQKPIAIVEVQGYAYAAYLAAAELYAVLGETELAGAFRARAETLRAAFVSAFYLPGLNYYAHGLDGDKRPMRVKTSNPAHALWTGIFPPEHAAMIAREALSSELWSGWGIRTVAEGAPRFNPVSYHNGSVWPHDTALAALGMRRYGLEAEARTVARALFDAARWSPDRRLHELFAGYAREDGPPVPFPAACHPQGWDAVIPLALAPLLEGTGQRESAD